MSAKVYIMCLLLDQNSSFKKAVNNAEINMVERKVKTTERWVVKEIWSMSLNNPFFFLTLPLTV